MPPKPKIPLMLKFKATPSKVSRSKKPKAAAIAGGGPAAINDEEIDEYESVNSQIPELATPQPVAALITSGADIDIEIARAQSTLNAKKAHVDQLSEDQRYKDIDEALADEEFKQLQAELAAKQARIMKLDQLQALRAQIAIEDAKIAKLRAASPPRALPKPTNLAAVIDLAIAQAGRDFQPPPPTVAILPGEPPLPFEERIAAMISAAVQAAVGKTQEPRTTKGKYPLSVSEVTRRQPKPTSDPFDDPSDTASELSDVSFHSQVLQRASNRSLVAINAKADIEAAFAVMFRNKQFMTIKRAAAALVSGSPKTGVPFIAAMGEVFVEYFEHINHKPSCPRAP